MAASFSIEESAASYFAPVGAECGPSATAIGAPLLGAPQRGGSCTSFSSIGVLEWQAPIAARSCAPRGDASGGEKKENLRLQVIGAGKGMGERRKDGEMEAAAMCIQRDKEATRQQSLKPMPNETNICANVFKGLVRTSFNREAQSSTFAQG
jgi:hypothetical protein